MDEEVYKASVVVDVVDHTEPAMSNIQRKVSSFERGLMATGARLQKWGRSLSSVGRSMTRYITLPIVAIGAASLKMYADFQQSFTRIRALVGIGGQALNKMRQQVLDLGRRMPQGPQALADALYFVTSSGFKGAKAMSILRSSAKAAAAGLGDTQTVADAVTSAVNAYGIENLKAARATDILLATVREGKSEPTELAASIGRVIAPAQAMGVEFHEVGAVLAALSLTGLDAAEGVTGFRGALMTFMGPTAKTREALHGLGMDVVEVQKSIADKGFFQTMVELRKAFGYTAEEAADLADRPLGALKASLGENKDAISAVFGNVRALNAFLALTGRNAEKNAEINSRLAKSTGDTATAFRKASSDPMFRFNKALSNIKTTLIEVAPTVLPIAERILHVLEGWAKAIGRMPQEKLERIVGWLIKLAIAGPALRLIGGGMTVGGGLLRGIAGAGRFFGRGAARATAGAGTSIAAEVAGTAAGAAAPSAITGTFGRLAVQGGAAAAGGASASAGAAGVLGTGLSATGVGAIAAGIGLLIWQGFRKGAEEDSRRRDAMDFLGRHGVDARGPRATEARRLVVADPALQERRLRDLAHVTMPTGARGAVDLEATERGMLRDLAEAHQRLHDMRVSDARKETQDLNTQLNLLEAYNGRLTQQENRQVRAAISAGKYGKATKIVATEVQKAGKAYLKTLGPLKDIQDGFQGWTDSSYGVIAQQRRVNDVLAEMKSTYDPSVLVDLIRIYGDLGTAARVAADNQARIDLGLGGRGGGGGGAGGGGNHLPTRHGRQDYAHKMRLHGPGTLQVGDIDEDISFSGPVSRGGGGRSVYVAPGAVVINAQTLDDRAVRRAAKVLADEIAGDLDEHFGNTP